MKKVLSILVAAALGTAAFAQSAASAPSEPKKNVISAFRVWVKPGQTNAFKQALSAHAKKFHTGDWRWRVGEVMSGPDGGAFHILEGPTSWTALDDRGDLGAEHQSDFERNIMPHIERITPDSYSVYSDELSTTGLGNYSDKVLIIRYYPKPGKGGQAFDVLKRYKAIWEKRGLNVGVWTVAWSGESQYSVAFRLKNGWKDFNMDGMSNREASNQLWGPNAWDGLMADTAECFERIWSETVNFDSSLGSN
jgi:hypothetical protein